MRHRSAVLLWAAFAVALLLLARGLPQRTFFAGDSGLKLIAARNAAEHPTRPLDIDLPRVGGRPVGLLDPSFRMHGDHAHAKTSELFPVLTAPFIVAFGIGGVYVLPALGFLLALAAAAWLGVTLDGRRSPAAIVFAAAACTPLLFYGLECWEHAPAVGVAALATALLVRRRSVTGLMASGFLLGVSALLRPEAAWYCAALAVGARWFPSRLTLRDMAAVVAGMAIAWVPAVAVSLFHFGQLLGGHVTGNMAGLSEGWWRDRASTFRLWLTPEHAAWAAACLLLPAAAVATRARPAARRAVEIAGATSVAAVTVAAAAGGFEPASAWRTAPATLLLLTPLWLGERRGTTFLAVVAAADVLFVLLTAPNDGGAQWGPRYLLFAFIPLAILTADALSAAASRRGVAAAVVVAVVMASSLMVQRSAYKNLRGAKLAYERLLGFVESGTPPGGCVVTDLWWFQQVTAAMYPTRTVLFVDGTTSARRALALLDGESNVSVVRSELESAPDPLDSWLEGTRFVVGRQTRWRERTLVLSELARRHQPVHPAPVER